MRSSLTFSFGNQLSHTVLKSVPEMSAEFDVVYGISSAMPGFIPGDFHTSMAHGHSSILFVLKDRRMGWSFISKMEKKYKGNEIPRRDNSQSNAHIQKYPDFEVGNNTKLTDLWKNVTTSNYAVFEESVMETWTCGRMICIGDAVHKATINVR